MAATKLPDATYLRQCFDYEPKTGTLLWRRRPPEHFPHLKECRRWNGRYAGKIVGNTKPDPRDRCVQLTINEVAYTAHRVIWKLQTGQEPQEIDHRDCDAFNNKWDNLRAADHAKRRYYT